MCFPSREWRKYERGRRLIGRGWSRDPTDRLIRELIRDRRRAASPEEIERIVERMATAPYQGQVRVPPKHRGLTYRGRVVGSREDSLFLHLAQRVDEEQWAHGTTGKEYLEDLRNAIRDPRVWLVLYERMGGNLASVFTKNSVPESRRGSESLGYLFVVYPADRGSIITGHQASALEEVDISKDPRWPKR